MHMYMYLCTSTSLPLTKQQPHLLLLNSTTLHTLTTCAVLHQPVLHYFLGYTKLHPSHTQLHEYTLSQGTYPPLYQVNSPIRLPVQSIISRFIPFYHLSPVIVPSITVFFRLHYLRYPPTHMHLLLLPAHTFRVYLHISIYLSFSINLQYPLQYPFFNSTSITIHHHYSTDHHTLYVAHL